MKYSAVLLAACLAASPVSALAACPSGYSEHETYRGTTGTIEFDDEDSGGLVHLELRGSDLITCPLEPVDDTPTASIGSITCGPYSAEPFVFHIDGDVTVSVEFSGHIYYRDCSQDVGL